ncbi:MAG: DNA methyltransferase, partial [Phycisphaerae bacterium]
SDRQKIYRDKRANPEGKMPDDVWDEYPRLCGTFDERINFPCQMPESLLARIIRTSSKKDYWVLDPFSGSGTTAVVAHKLNRKYTGIEISPKYVKESIGRIKQSEGVPVEGEGMRKWTDHLDSELKWLYHENKIPSDSLIEDPYLLSLFTDKFNKKIGEHQNFFQPQDVRKHLIQLRKSAKLGPLRANIETLNPSKNSTARTKSEEKVKKSEN